MFVSITTFFEGLNFFPFLLDIIVTNLVIAISSMLVTNDGDNVKSPTSRFQNHHWKHFHYWLKIKTLSTKTENKLKEWKLTLKEVTLKQLIAFLIWFLELFLFQFDFITARVIKNVTSQTFQKSGTVGKSGTCYFSGKKLEGLKNWKIFHFDSIGKFWESFSILSTRGSVYISMIQHITAVNRRCATFWSHGSHATKVYHN